MCDLLQLEKISVIARDMFPGTVINIAPLFKHERHLNCLLNGLQVFNPVDNRRHSWDIMIHYNLYVKQLPDGFWECGEHNDSSVGVTLDNSPLVAIVEHAYSLIIAKDGRKSN